MTVPSVELSSLTVGEMVGDGGEGEVFSLINQPNDVLKIFKPVVRPEISESGLIATAHLLGTMLDADRDFVKARTCWPHTIVRENGTVVGFVMPALTHDFFCLHGQVGNPILGMNDWNKLAFRKAWMGNVNIQSDSPAWWYPDGNSLDSMSAPTKDQRKELLFLLADLAQLFEILHKYNVVVGDVSGRNILFARGSQSRAMLIDCDGCRVENTVGVTRAKQSPDWFDPELADVTTIQSDLYKLAVALYRGYFSDGLGLPAKNTQSFASRADNDFLAMAIRGTSATNRPTASEWRKLFLDMQRAAEFDDRPIIDWPGSVPIAPRTPVREVDDPAQDRPSISWK